MGKHSKNNGARGFFSSHERAKAGLGTTVKRYGKDAQKPFDHCHLCLQVVTTPVCCQEGHIFCKECIYAYLLAQKKAVKEGTEKWEKEQLRIEESEKGALRLRQEEDLKSFERSSSGVPAAAESTFVMKPKLEAIDELAKQGSSLAIVVAEREKVKETLSNTERRVMAVRDARPDEEKTLAHNYWLPMYTPSAKEVVKRPEGVTVCPASSHVLKLKNLSDLHFQDVKKGKEEASDGDMFECPSCLRTLSTQPSIAMRKCGHVLCSDCVTKFVKISHVCYVCSEKLNPGKDYIDLEKGGTAFSSHSKVESSQWKPTHF